MEEEFKKTESKVARINYNIHNEVVDELEETRNLESVQESARFAEPKNDSKGKPPTSPKNAHGNRGVQSQPQKKG